MSIKSYFKGKFQEVIVDIGLFIGLDKKEYKVHSNVTLELLDEMTTQIDHVVVSKYGIFVIETKNYKGWIYGEEKQNTWIQVLFKRKNKFQNPIRQNYKHIKFLQTLLSIPDVLELQEKDFESIIFFSHRSKFKTEMPTNVMQKGLVPYIKGFKDVRLNDIRIQKINERLATKRLEVGIFTDIKHVQNLKKQFGDDESNEQYEPKKKRKLIPSFVWYIAIILSMIYIVKEIHIMDKINKFVSTKVTESIKIPLKTNINIVPNNQPKEEAKIQEKIKPQEEEKTKEETIKVQQKEEIKTKSKNPNIKIEMN